MLGIAKVSGTYWWTLERSQSSSTGPTLSHHKVQLPAPGSGEWRSSVSLRTPCKGPQKVEQCLLLGLSGRPAVPLPRNAAPGWVCEPGLAARRKGTEQRGLAGASMQFFWFLSFNIEQGILGNSQ